MHLKQLIGFLNRSGNDHRIGPHHIALYVALLQECCINDCARAVNVRQSHLRKSAKLGRTTYHKCMHELKSYGYIEYEPSYSPVVGSLVYLVKMGE